MATLRKRPALTEGQYDKYVAELRAFVKESVSPFENDTPAKKKARIKRSLRDKLYFMETYLPHYFTVSFGDFHEEWADIADLKDQFALVGAPREHAKSTFFTFGDPLHVICHALIWFGFIISDTHEQAQDFTVAIKIELEENVRIRHDFGDLRGKSWSDDDFRTKDGVRIMARGHKDKVRGLKNGPHRPDYARFDDMENDENVENPRRVKKLISWIRGSVLGSLGKGYRALMVANLFNPRSAISQLIAMTNEDTGEPLYFSRVYDCILDEGTPEERPLWPANWPMERLRKKRIDMGSFDFNREMRNKVAVEGSPFPEEQAKYYEEQELQGKMLITVSGLDPSARAGENNDFRAVVTFSLDPGEMIFYCRHAWLKKKSIGEMFGAAYAQHDEYGSGTVEVEENMLKDFLHDAIANYAKEVRRYLPWSPVNHSTNKEGRIVGTCAYLWEFGKIRFIKGHSDQNRLVEQFIYLLTPTVNDDGPDASEMAISKLQSMAGGVFEYRSTGRRRASSSMDAYLEN